jgi:hypothetical protein
MTEETQEKSEPKRKLLYPEMSHLSKIEYRRYYQNMHYQLKRDEKRLAKDLAMFGRIINRERGQQPSKHPDYVKEYNKRYYVESKEKRARQAKQEASAQGTTL